MCLCCRHPPVAEDDCRQWDDQSDDRHRGEVGGCAAMCQNRRVVVVQCRNKVHYYHQVKEALVHNDCSSLIARLLVVRQRLETGFSMAEAASDCWHRLEAEASMAMT